MISRLKNALRKIHTCFPLQNGKWQKDCTSANQKGSALIVTLLLVTILTGLAVDFVYEVYIDTSATSNWGNAQRASFIAKSGQNIGADIISSLKNEDYIYQRELAFPVLRDFGPGVNLFVKIEDESAKLDINSIINENGSVYDKAFASLQKLLQSLNINPSIAESIADWIDPDSEPRLFDSENGAKNAYLWSVDELQFIDGIDGESLAKMRPYITVFKETTRPRSLININTAQLPVLMSLHPDMTELLAQNIIDYRQRFPFDKPADVRRVSGMNIIGQLIGERISVKALKFRVTTTATVNEITRVIESVMDTSLKIQFWREG